MTTTKDTITAMRSLLNEEREALAKKQREEYRRPVFADGYEHSYALGHETSTTRLLPIIEKAVEIMYQIGLARCPKYIAHPQSVWFDEHVQEKAREFLAELLQAATATQKETLRGFGGLND